MLESFYYLKMIQRSNPFLITLKQHLLTINPLPELPDEILIYYIMLRHSSIFSSFYRSSKKYYDILKSLLPKARKLFRVPYPEQPMLYIYPDGRTYGFRKIKIPWALRKYEEYEYYHTKERAILAVDGSFFGYVKGNEKRLWKVIRNKSLPSSNEYQLIEYRRGDVRNKYKGYYCLRYNDNAKYPYHEEDWYRLCSSFSILYSIPEKQLPGHERALQDALILLTKLKEYKA